MTTREIIERETFTPDELGVRWGIGTESARALLKSGEIPAIAAGNRLFAPVRAIEAYERRLGELAAEKRFQKF